MRREISIFIKANDNLSESAWLELCERTSEYVRFAKGFSDRTKGNPLEVVATQTRDVSTAEPL